MQIRKAIPADAESIMQIFRQAQTGLRVQGVNQWPLHFTLHFRFVR